MDNTMPMKKNDGMMKDDMKNCMMMKDGKMMQSMDGKTMMMEKTVTLANGTMVMTDGMVKMKDGKSMKLKEGECIDENGMITKMKMEKKMMKNDGKM